MCLESVGLCCPSGSTSSVKGASSPAVLGPPRVSRLKPAGAHLRWGCFWTSVLPERFRESQNPSWACKANSSPPFSLVLKAESSCTHWEIREVDLPSMRDLVLLISHHYSWIFILKILVWRDCTVWINENPYNESTYTEGYTSCVVGGLFFWTSYRPLRTVAGTSKS